ncbi:hypothetical protein F0562_016992 [Nyssa sinensis]|uniref:Uncharacterized protein n=1 Tax=Nyssa sinensis TaxID=561372 RepID=A0A5J4ZFR5_9ASTE|nr:hypothetical protein F0562_016992 [Nyssa sinensis]
MSRFANSFWKQWNLWRRSNMVRKDGHYRHALPPGYVLKSQMKALIEEETEKIPIEEEIENQVIIEISVMNSLLSTARAKLTTSTPMTPVGRELFMSDSSLFVDDAEAYEKYQREEESVGTEQKFFGCLWLPVDKNSATDGPSTLISTAGDAEFLLDDNENDELDMDELNELEASLSRTSIQNSEPGSKK